MQTQSAVSLAEYLETSYRPDCDYVDGEIRERNVGTTPHSSIQGLLVSWFLVRRKTLRLMPLPDVRMRVRPGRYRVPDVAVVPFGPTPDVLVDPPLLAIEIVSPDDSYAELQLRCLDYAAMGVQSVWIIDPVGRTARMLIDGHWVETDKLIVAGTRIRIALKPLFKLFDESQTA